MTPISDVVSLHDTTQDGSEQPSHYPAQTLPESSAHCYNCNIKEENTMKIMYYVHALTREKTATPTQSSHVMTMPSSIVTTQSLLTNAIHISTCVRCLYLD